MTRDPLWSICIRRERSNGFPSWSQWRTGLGSPWTGQSSIAEPPWVTVWDVWASPFNTGGSKETKHILTRSLTGYKSRWKLVYSFFIIEHSGCVNHSPCAPPTTTACIRLSCGRAVLTKMAARGNTGELQPNASWLKLRKKLKHVQDSVQDSFVHQNWRLADVSEW